MAQRIGFSTQALQEWGYVAKMNGMELDVLQTGMKTFTTAMDGSSAAGVAACKKLGISIQGLSAEEAFDAAITALQGVSDETEKMALATDLFGAKAAQQMMPMLKQTAADTEALKQKANELGLVYSEDMVAAATTFGDSWDTVGMVVQSLGAQLGTALMPAMTEVINIVLEQMPAITALIQQFTPMLTEMFENMIPQLTTIIEQLLPIIIELIMQLMPLIMEVFTAILPPLLELLMALLPPLTELITALLPVIISLIEILTPLFQPIIDLLTPILELAIAILTPLIELIGEILPPITQLITTLIDTALVPLGDAFSVVAEIISAVFEAAFQNLQNVMDGFQTYLTGLITFITGVFSGDWGAAWEGVKGIFEGVVNTLGAVFKIPINAIIGLINGFIRGLNKIKIPDWVPGVGGKGINISEIPLLAKGGDIQLSGAAIVGEAGPELVQLPRGAKVSPLKEGEGVGGNKTNNITQNNYFTQKELSPYQAQLEVKRLSRNLAGAF